MYLIASIVTCFARPFNGVEATPPDIEIP
jgi:hypothetical protein